jgi:hypothetical protein
MAPPGSTARRVTGELSDLTGRSDEELGWMLTVALAAGSVALVLRVLTVLDRLGILPGAWAK